MCFSETTASGTHFYMLKLPCWKKIAKISILPYIVSRQLFTVRINKNANFGHLGISCYPSITALTVSLKQNQQMQFTQVFGYPAAKMDSYLFILQIPMWVTEHFTLCSEYSLPCRNASEHSECSCLHKPWKVTGAFRSTTKWETCKGFFFREPHYIANDLSCFSLCWWVTTQHHPASLNCYSMYQSTAIYDVRCGCGILKWQTDTVCLLMCWMDIPLDSSEKGKAALFLTHISFMLN